MYSNFKEIKQQSRMEEIKYCSLNISGVVSFHEIFSFLHLT